MPSESRLEHQKPTAAEREILALIAEGQSDAAAAAALRLSTVAVGQRIHRFCDRTGIRGRRLVVWAREHRTCCIAVPSRA